MKLSKMKYVIVVFGIIAFFLVTASSYAQDMGKFNVVAGSSDNAYLVNTETGAVWILTYRTLATGREPIAIPYKFLKITPGDDKFLFEDYKGLSIEEELKKGKK